MRRTIFCILTLFACGGLFAQTYKIGDTGPAGGIVFYDRGFSMDGWRYLEAAPAGTDDIYICGAYGHDVSGTVTGVGYGKRNTQIIVEKMRQLGVTGTAAQRCASLDINGYRDWFLPSKDELDLMYQNLARRGLGGFGVDYNYLSSSQRDIETAWSQVFVIGEFGVTFGRQAGRQGWGYKGNLGNWFRAIRAF